MIRSLISIQKLKLVQKRASPLFSNFFHIKDIKPLLLQLQWLHFQSTSSEKIQDLVT